MSEHVTSAGVYVVVFVVLVLFTIATVAISFVHLEGPWHVVVGEGIALIKATLVVMFFMHALHSPHITWLVIAASIVWLIVLFALTLCDYMTRGIIPFMPGH